ncbi:MAG: ABC transporter ATP-binding protein [Deltaproteobacteria bacterium]|nr:ABC transporter ATP-binding protein [Deltaproteobacteria bacterium]
MSAKSHIEIRNVFFSYDKEVILENVNINIQKGDFAGIVGPNGGGKTTLLKLILGRLKPDRGEIKVFGNDPKKSYLRIGYMPQHAYLDTLFPVSVMDVVLMGRLGRSLGGRYSKKDRQAAETALEEMKITSMAERHFSELSGGQRQRTLIARALCSEPELLLLDEPTANVDPEVEEAFFDILKNLNKRMTILIVSHDIGFVSQKVKSAICVNRCVVVHPTSEINGMMIKDIYGGDVCMIRHDHRCSVDGHHG